MRIGGLPASELLPGASALAARWNMPGPSAAWLSFRSSVHVNGLASTSTILTAVFSALIRSPLSSPSSPTPTPTSLPTPHYRRACRPRSTPKPVVTCSIRRHSSVTARHISASTGFLGLVLGSSLVWTPSSPTSRHPYSGSPSSHWSHDTNCTLCKSGDHALTCRCGGDRVSRPNVFRDVVHMAVNDRANLAAVMEKPGLLTLRDPVDEDCPPDLGPA